jgi:hypothetical protein
MTQTFDTQPTDTTPQDAPNSCQLFEASTQSSPPSICLPTNNTVTTKYMQSEDVSTSGSMGTSTVAEVEKEKEDIQVTTNADGLSLLKRSLSFPTQLLENSTDSTLQIPHTRRLSQASLRVHYLKNPHHNHPVPHNKYCSTSTIPSDQAVSRRHKRHKFPKSAPTSSLFSSPPVFWEEEEDQNENLTESEQLEAQLSARPVWVPDEARKNCRDCDRSFHLVRRRHHCRACGDIFCRWCTSNRITIPRLGYTEYVRVCDSCWVREAELRYGPPSRRKPTNKAKLNNIDKFLFATRCPPAESESSVLAVQPSLLLKLLKDESSDGVKTVRAHQPC